MDYLYNIIKNDVTHWESIHEQMVQELKVLPTGTLIKHTTNGYEYLYHQYSVNGKQKFKSVKENEQDLIRGLLRRAYDTEMLPNIEKNLRTLHRCMVDFKVCNPEKAWEKVRAGKYQNLKLSTSIGYELSPAYGGNLPVALDWMEKTFPPNEKYAEDLKHLTRSGTLVRSKSELNIATLFEMNGIAYKYEQPVIIEGTPFYIDFSYLRPSDMKEMRWEHFGLTNDEDYLYNIEHKLAIYRENGITLWDNLVISFDTPNGGLDGRALQRLFDVFVLS